MGSHNYAFKYQGKTLGIENAEQLLRIINSGKLGNDDSVFVIADKQWIKISKLPAYIEYTNKAADTNAVSKKSNPKAATKTNSNAMTSTKTRAFAKLMDDMDSKDSKEDNNFDQPVLTESRPTIHKLSGMSNPGKTSRITQTVVAAKVPNPESNWRENPGAIIAAVVVLLIGVTVGFLGGFQLTDQNNVNNGQVILQAQKDVADLDVSDN